MKLTNLFLALATIMMTSCTSVTYFQVYHATPSDKFVVEDSQLFYEDGNCRVFYNLWSEGGNIGFKFFNKTDKNIYLNMEESFFVLNGISYNYYKNRTYTNSTNSGIATSAGISTTKYVTGVNYLNLLQTNGTSASNAIGLSSSSGFAVSYAEEKIVCIPPKTAKNISEYKINGTLFRDCDLLRYPTKRQIKPLTFSKEQSPLVFSNRIAYTIGQSDSIIRFENEFYINEISNYPESEIFESKYDKYCGQESMTMTKYFKNASADMFYIKYTKGGGSWKY